MNESPYLWAPRPVPSLPVKGRRERAPVNRIFCVGRNYHAHAAEMGRPVDKSGGRPFYFIKSPQALVETGATIPYPPETTNLIMRWSSLRSLARPGFAWTRTKRMN
jgi:fumarylpyruvate hydrolase